MNFDLADLRAFLAVGDLGAFKAASDSIHLSQSALSRRVDKLEEAPDQPQNLGHFFILINTKLLGSTEWLANRMHDFAAILHDSAPADPARPVLVPGEIELAKMGRQRKEGFSIGADVIALLHKHAVNAFA